MGGASRKTAALRPMRRSLPHQTPQLLVVTGDVTARDLGVARTVYSDAGRGKGILKGVSHRQGEIKFVFAGLICFSWFASTVGVISRHLFWGCKYFEIPLTCLGFLGFEAWLHPLLVVFLGFSRILPFRFTSNSTTS